MYITLPALVVFLTAYLLIKKFLDAEYVRSRNEMIRDNRKVIAPLQIQAYERIVLFLERITPSSLVMRVHQNGMSSRLLQTELVKNIRQEFEHNMAQQVYIGSETWEMVKTAKEETIRLVNIAASQMKDDATGIDLSTEIFALTAKMDRLPTEITIEFLKKELRAKFK